MTPVAVAPGSTIDGVEIPEDADRARMRAERRARLQEQLAAQHLDALLLLGTANVSYATGAQTPANDAARSVLRLLPAATSGLPAKPSIGSGSPYPARMTGRRAMSNDL